MIFMRAFCNTCSDFQMEKTDRTVVFSSRPFPNILRYRYHWWDLPKSGKQNSFRHILKTSASIRKVQTHSSLEPSLDYNQDQMHLMNQGSWWLFLTILGVTEILCSFRLVLEGKTGKEIPESSRLEFLKKFLADNFTLSEAEDNISRLLNRQGIPDLPFLRTLLAICQKY